MERFRVNLAPFNEALEHVRSILLQLHSNRWVYRSRGERAKAALPMRESRLTGSGSTRLRYSDFRPSTCHAVKTPSLLARIAGCRRLRRRLAPSSYELRTGGFESWAASTQIPVARRHLQSSSLTTTLLLLLHHRYHPFPFDIPSLRHREQLTCS